ncbi:hypothetical protein Ddc_24111 [Ditylenchus destructor]|nr:hypothetical protein Ddc_24111 [Ditylenchus destructor]
MPATADQHHHQQAAARRPTQFWIVHHVAADGAVGGPLMQGDAGRLPRLRRHPAAVGSGERDARCDPGGRAARIAEHQEGVRAPVASSEVDATAEEVANAAARQRRGIHARSPSAQGRQEEVRHVLKTVSNPSRNEGRTILRAPLAPLNATALRAPPSRLATSGARRPIPVVSPAPRL